MRVWATTLLGAMGLAFSSTAAAHQFESAYIHIHFESLVLVACVFIVALVVVRVIGGR